MRKLFFFLLFVALSFGALLPPVPAARAEGDCCTTHLEDAKKICGKSGVSSFSCSATTCAYSFTCNGLAD